MSLADEMHDAAMRLKETGISHRQIAARLGISPTTVNRIIRPRELARARPPQAGNGRMWLHEVQTLGPELMKKLDSLWPPTKTPDEDDAREV
jgi:transcriptional regulator with XRE-family HTH domain